MAPNKEALRRVCSLLVLSVALAAVALGGSSSCQTAGTVGCAPVDSVFNNVGVGGGDPALNLSNPSFESPVLGSGIYTGDNHTQNNSTGCASPPCAVLAVIPGWSATASGTGLYGIGTHAGLGNAPIPDGTQAAYLSVDAGGTGSVSLTQNVDTNGLNNTDGPGGSNGGVIAAATTYTLTIYVGAGDFMSSPPTFGVELVDANTSTVLATGSGDVIPLGGFVTYTASFDSASIGTIGDQIEVKLFASGTPVSLNTQVLFDNVQLGYESDVPEPGSIGLVLLGLGGLAVLRRRAAKTHRI